MNRRMTPILLTVVLALGVITYVSERSASSENRSEASGPPRVLSINAADVLQIRIRRDFWNSFTLKHGEDGSWSLIEPSLEPAASASVSKLLETLANLAVIAKIDLPSDDSERHRQYGLWQPAMEVTVTTSAGDRTIAIGNQTPDAQGTYCSVTGRDGIFVIPIGSTKIIATELAVYRAASASPAAMKTAGTLRIEDTLVGSGETLRPGQKALVHYTGRLENGTEFDSSNKQGRPFTVTVGAQQVIRGWDEGLPGMKVGGKRRLTIPPDLAYGEKGRPPQIPPNSTLVFDIELLSIQPEQAKHP